MNAQTNSESIENIMKLADAYARANAIAFWQHDQGWKKATIDDAKKENRKTRAALKAAVEELYASLAKDAERYQWIRKRIDKLMILQLSNNRVYGVDEWNLNMDASIDEAMKGQSWPK